MRFAILGPAHPYRGGIAMTTERLAEALVAAGHEVEVVTFTLQYPDALFPGASQTDDRPPPDGYRVTRKLNSVNPLSYVATGRYLRSLDPDVIVTRYWLPFLGPALGAALRVARRGSRARVVAIADNVVPHERRPGDAAFTRYFCGAVDDFVVMSRSVAADLEAFATAGQRVAYHPHPVYDNYGEPVGRTEALAHLGLDPSPHYALFFGFIRDYKGLGLLLDAVADERFGGSLPDGRPVKLIVAGEYYGNREAYERQIARLGIADRLVLRTAFVPHEDVRHYFGAADVVVQPYRTATQSGISQMAYHFGVPMVVTAVGGLPEIVPDGEAGYVVAPEPAAVAGALWRYLAEADRAAFRQNVARLARQFSWAALVEVVEGLGSSPPPSSSAPNSRTRLSESQPTSRG